MKIRFLTAERPWLGKLVAATCLAAFLPLATIAQTATRSLHGHVPAATAHLTPIGRLPATNHLYLAIGLPLRNQEALNSLLQQLYDPSSTNYHHYLTPAQFTAQFGPTEQDYQAVIDFAKGNGLAVVCTYSNRMLLDVRGTVAVVEKAFHVKMNVYQHPFEKRTFYAPDVEPSVLSELKILDLNGLNNYRLPRPLIRKSSAGHSSANRASLGTGSSPDGTGNFFGYDFRDAYAPGVSLDGSGQTVALFECNDYFDSDITEYVDLAGLPGVPLQRVLVEGYEPAPVTGDGGNTEVALDIEMLNCMAPNLSQIIVYETPNDNTAYDGDMLARIAGDNLARQISSSWLINDSTQYAQFYQEFAAQGQSFFQASGDEDAYYFPGIFQWEDSPLVTLVGGTTLTTTGPHGAYMSETVWNWGVEYGSIYAGIGGGGGISTNYTIPSWQTNISMTANKGSTTKRNVPDVALTADNIFVIADDGVEEPYEGGTSCAAPLWAGFIALVNQQAANVGQSPVGFINPAIYAIGSGGNYLSDFHDITTGNNTSPNSPTNYYAVAGYDLCTGWGTPAGKQLIDALVPPCQPDGILEVAVTPANGSVLLSGAGPQAFYVQVTDGVPVTNAAVYAIGNNKTNAFNNSGVSPDLAAGDDIYSTNIVVPPNTNSLALTLVVTAPGKTGCTNVLTYNVVPIPVNDNFANAIRATNNGEFYLSNNKFATTEPGEPTHDGLISEGASLWWIWQAPVNTNVLIDGTGSGINLALAVYTGNKLTSLSRVAATNNVGTGKSAWLELNAVSNTTYMIAVASANATSVGSIKFRVLPGGQPDTNAPVVTVTSPLNGYGTTNFLLTVSGTALDQQPNASGVSQIFITVNSQCTITASGTTNWSATFGLTPGLNNISVFAEDYAGNISTPVVIQVAYIVQLPPNDFFANAFALTNLNLDAVTNAGATKELGEPAIAGNAGGHSVWWYYQPPSDGVLTLSTSNSTFDTVMAMYTGTNVANLTTIAINDDAYSGALGGFSEINQAVKSNQVYHITVDGFNGTYGYVVLHYSFVPKTLYNLTVANNAGGTVQVTCTTTNMGTNVSVLQGTSGYFASNATVVVTAVPNQYYQFNGWSWSGSLTSSANPLSLVIVTNTTLTGTFGLMTYSDGFESGDLTHLNWRTPSGVNMAPWFVQTNVVRTGQYAARSGVITDSQSSSLFLFDNFAAGIGSFDYLVSSEQYWDTLSFYVDGVLKQRWSGQVGWANFAFPLTAGWHTLEWSYVKDPSFSDGLDAGFIDNVNLPSFVNQPQFGSVTYTGGTVQLTVSNPPLSTIIQTTTNLISTNWVNVFTGTPPFIYIDPQASNYPIRFYRAIFGP